MSSFSYCKYPWNDEKQWQFQASPLLRMFQNHLFTRLNHKHHLKLCLCSSFSRFTNASPPGASKAHHLAAALEGCYFVAGAPAQKNRSSGAPITANPSWQIADLHKVTIPFRPNYQELDPWWSLLPFINAPILGAEAIVLRQSLKSVSLCVVFADAEGKARPSTRCF